jgi:hypothetical protein
MENKTVIGQSNTCALAWSLLVIFVSSILTPSYTIAGGGGPTQPEVQGFTPMGVSDMVDPFTGDFTYNIPLMDVEGFPINIAYNSGVSMDQEASWVGLGWNLNIGSVVRNMRGLPDDFSGDDVVKEINQKANTTIGVDVGLNMEIFGAKPDKIVGNSGMGLNLGLGINYNNYNGWASQFSIGPSFNFGKSAGLSGTAGFSLSGSSENGSSFSPSLSFDSKTKRNTGTDKDMSTTIGAGMNSRAGLQAISYSNTIDRKITISKNKAAAGKHDKGNVGGSYNVGLQTYSPSSGPSMFGLSLSGSFNMGLDGWGIDAQLNGGISFSKQWIPEHWKTIHSPAYGYFTLNKGQSNDKALLDFNRDDDGSFTKYSRSLPSTYLTYDIFTVQAQGTSGSFRGFRNDVGYVFDPKVINSDAGGSVGFELGFGAITDIGVDVQLSYSSSKSGRWKNRNDADEYLKFQDTKAGELVGAYSMQEANERMVDGDNLIISNFGATNQSYFPLSGGFAGMTKLKDELKNVPSGSMDLADNQRSSRIQTNNLMSFLSIKDVQSGLGVDEIPTNLSSDAKNHHIGEITQLGTDGRRYVFGIAAYNNEQKDVTFAIGKKINGDLGYTPNDDYSGLVNYSGANLASLAGLGNDYGIDNYYSSTKTPAYAHAFMLTSVLGEDYVDSDNEKGPSANDLGAYVKIEYEKVENHQWRTPIEEKSAYFNEGMKTDFTDDKASYVYGEKELWYVKGIETKNYIAVFVLEPRKDGRSSLGEHGGIDTTNATSMKLLKKIILYSKPDYNANIGDLSQATPIKEITFIYDYHLCKNYPANSNISTTDNGKLTLREIQFTYQGSNKMKNRSYKFNYDGLNPNYNLKAVDRWGTYKPTSNGLENPITPSMTNADYPYTEQSNASNDYASAWHLTGITLPTGGKITVEYESDDYGFVQHLPAAKMFKIVAVDQVSSIPTEGLTGTPVYQNISVDNVGSLEKNKAILFKLDDPNDDLSEYASIGQQLYFRVLMEFRENMNDDEKGKCEYVSGYARITNLTKVTVGGQVLGRIELESEKLTDLGNEEYSPITKAGLQFGRMHLSRYIFDQPSSNEASGSEQGLMDFLNSLASSITSMGELFTGPNKAIYNKDRGVNIVVNKSFIRLKEPTGKKLGGGSRVKRLLMSDSWGEMTTGNASQNYSYGQEFTYELENGRSSGVASYEPQIGGDENPWRTAYVVNNKKRFALDDNLFVEDPIMESQFPSPSIGYSRVVIKDLPRNGVTKTATGKVVKEFYTARDFPTIVKRSNIDLTTANSFLPLLPTYQYITASQGFVIELNDMHGKPKKESVYAENKSMPLSTVEYIYQSTELSLGGLSNKKLVNTATVINNDGSSSSAEIGVKYDAVADFRESQTNSLSGKVSINTNGLLFGFLPVVIPTVYPSMDVSESRFRSATLNKTVYRFGIMNKMIANQDGSVVETNNLAYDSKTGEVLATQTTTDFNDKVYSMNYPAYWKYKELGQASQNIGYSVNVGSTNSNGFAIVPQSINYFSEGDEVRILSLLNLFNSVKAWVVEKNSSGIRLIDKQGNPIVVQNALVTVIRSGYINRQSESMASLTSLSNPINGLQSGSYTNVLNAGAIEFGDNWKTACACFNTTATATSNPFVNGTRGNFRPVRSYTHLSGRAQTDYDNNTNIRKDGVFTSYSPYYKYNQGQWNAQGENWTFVSEVTEFSPNGMTLETKDALGRYSSSLYSFNNTMVTAVAANTQLKQLAFGSFEDVNYTNCMDNSFFKTVPVQNISNEQAHSGKTSVKVTAGNSLTISNTVNSCKSEDYCNITLSATAMQGIAQINNGTGPYILSSEVVSGDIDAQLNNDNTITFTLPAGYDFFEIIISLTDSSGCEVSYLISGTKTSYSVTLISTNQN